MTPRAYGEFPYNGPEECKADPERPRESLIVKARLRGFPASVIFGGGRLIALLPCSLLCGNNFSQPDPAFPGYDT